MKEREHHIACSFSSLQDLGEEGSLKNIEEKQGKGSLLKSVLSNVRYTAQFGLPASLSCVVPSTQKLRCVVVSQRLCGISSWTHLRFWLLFYSCTSKTYWGWWRSVGQKPETSVQLNHIYWDYCDKWLGRYCWKPLPVTKFIVIFNSQGWISLILLLESLAVLGLGWKLSYKVQQGKVST